VAIKTDNFEIRFKLRKPRTEVGNCITNTVTADRGAVTEVVTRNAKKGVVIWDTIN